ncbi:hypothetical protein E4U26_006689 [Claviceps purpurea]|nr:hypothetical protein E4U26_006689 [Claviceps purpurea]
MNRQNCNHRRVVPRRLALMSQQDKYQDEAFVGEDNIQANEQDFEMFSMSVQTHISPRSLASRREFALLEAPPASAHIFARSTSPSSSHLPFADRDIAPLVLIPSNHPLPRLAHVHASDLLSLNCHPSRPSCDPRFNIYLPILSAAAVRDWRVRPKKPALKA